MDAQYRLDDKTDQEIQDLIESGEFETSEQVLKEGVRLVRLHAGRRAKLLELVRPALDSFDQGLGIPAEEVFDQLIAKYDKMAAEQDCDRPVRTGSGGGFN